MSRTVLGKVGMTPKGAYSNTTKYVRLYVVTYAGCSYVCLKDCTGKDVTNKEYWQLIAEKGKPGYTPIKGTDYFTETEIEEFTNTITTNVNNNIGLVVDIINGEEV